MRAEHPIIGLKNDNAVADLKVLYAFSDADQDASSYDSRCKG
jgi:hypothetical protein